ncbi:hypothetical protein ABW22_03695 [Thiobacillus denitrificans]|uniref:Uncharacterized protein n=1 Tax=Thiobacillus denitrificans TaxID=36861 RepID=A0A119CX94_THIDE|nr:hypothetical protein ABW22_03695 [Thiobacillus denitrificans]
MPKSLKAIIYATGALIGLLVLTAIALFFPLDASRLQLSDRDRPGNMKKLSLSAGVACGAVRTKAHAASDLKFTVAGQRGVFDLKPFTMRVYAGQGSGTYGRTLRALFPATTSAMPFRGSTLMHSSNPCRRKMPRKGRWTSPQTCRCRARP